MRLEGKVAVITGGGAGIGRASVELFAKEGASVVLVDHDEVAGRSVRDAVVARGHRCIFLKADVSEPDSMRAAIRAAR